MYRLPDQTDNKFKITCNICKGNNIEFDFTKIDKFLVITCRTCLETKIIKQ